MANHIVVYNNFSVNVWLLLSKILTFVYSSAIYAWLSGLCVIQSLIYVLNIFVWVRFVWFIYIRFFVSYWFSCKWIFWLFLYDSMVIQDSAINVCASQGHRHVLLKRIAILLISNSEASFTVCHWTIIYYWYKDNGHIFADTVDLFYLYWTIVSVYEPGAHCSCSTSKITQQLSIYVEKVMFCQQIVSSGAIC